MSNEISISNNKNILKVTNLHVHYQEICAIHNMSFEISCNNAVAIIGGNGAGKTTLMKAIVGLIPKSQGTVYFKDKKIINTTNDMAFLPQKEKIDWNFPITVKDLIEMGRFPLVGTFNKFTKKDEEACEKAIELLDLKKLLKRQIGALSGGQQQRVFIARALAQNAQILLLDEPFTGLDQPSKTSLIKIIKFLTNEGKLIIASHHDLKTTQEIYDKILVINKKLLAFLNTNEKIDNELFKRAF